MHGRRPLAALRRASSPQRFVDNLERSNLTQNGHRLSTTLGIDVYNNAGRRLFTQALNTKIRAQRSNLISRYCNAAYLFHGDDYQCCNPNASDDIDKIVAAAQRRRNDH
jgi:hypothetical protein